MNARGKFFSVGGDIKTFTKDRDALPQFIKSASADLHVGISRFARMDAPLIMACHSLVTGGAVAVTAAADFAIATEDAKFYAAFTQIGFSCDSGQSHNLPRRVGHRKAFEFLARNQTWSSSEALEFGLLNQVVSSEEDLETESRNLAIELANRPTIAIGEIKRLLLSSYEQPLEAQLELESRALTRASATDDAWEGLNSVLEKRQPTFDGR
jgi:2-(1,2-epoxy-1,2-dihydrophenyl)acetyl-CoA isomerase